MREEPERTRGRWAALRGEFTDEERRRIESDPEMLAAVSLRMAIAARKARAREGLDKNEARSRAAGRASSPRSR